MSEKNKRKNEAAQAATQPETEASTTAQRAVEGEKLLLQLGKQVEELEAAAAQQQDQYKRVLAEYDNFRKRSAKERESVYADITAQTVGLFLPVLDNLERAAAQEDASQGAQMIYKQFCEILGKMNVVPCGAPGESFDPTLHNAVMHMEDPDLGENVIVEVLQKGYVMKEKLIRPAMVKSAN